MKWNSPWLEAVYEAEVNWRRGLAFAIGFAGIDANGLIDLAAAGLPPRDIMRLRGAEATAYLRSADARLAKEDRE